MSTERTPLVTDEQIIARAKTARHPFDLASGIRAEYEAELARKDAEIEALRNPWISVKDYDQAISEEIKNVSHVQYDSHEICKHFASKVRSRLTAAATNNTNDNEAR